MNLSDIIQNISPIGCNIPYQSLENLDEELTQFKLVEIYREECSDCEYSGSIHYKLLEITEIGDVCIATFEAYYTAGDLDAVQLIDWEEDFTYFKICVRQSICGQRNL